MTEKSLVPDKTRSLKAVYDLVDEGLDLVPGNRRFVILGPCVQGPELVADLCADPCLGGSADFDSILFFADARGMSPKIVRICLVRLQDMGLVGTAASA